MDIVKPITSQGHKCFLNSIPFILKKMLCKFLIKVTWLWKQNYLKFLYVISHFLSHIIESFPSLLCEINTNARLTCLGVWLDRRTDTKESPPAAAEPAPGK